MTVDALTAFKTKLTAGGYEVVTGARRAIGKFRNITDADKAKMHDLANKHFNVLPGKPKGASAPAVAAKPAAKKPAAPAPKALPPVKKAAAAPKALPAAKAAAPKAAAKKEVAPKAAPKAPRASRSQKPSAPVKSSSPAKRQTRATNS
jgi:hypothetical protein